MGILDAPGLARYANLSDLASAATARTNLLGSSGVVPSSNRIALLGDSITDNNSSLSTEGTPWLSAGGYFTWANLILGHRFEIVGPSYADPEFGASGATAGGIATDGTTLPAVAASSADSVFVLIGTNDCSTATVYTTITANLQIIFDAIRATGKRLIVATLLPRATADMSTARHLILRQVNTWIATYAIANRGVILIDWFPTLVDPLTGNANQIYLTDGTHPNTTGASKIGRFLADILGPLFPPLNRTSNLGDPANLLANPWLTGAASGSAVPSSWTAGHANVTVVTSKVARVDLIPGEWFQTAVSAITGTNANSFTGFSQTVTTGWAVGDRVQAVIEFETDAAGWDVRSLQLGLQAIGTTFHVFDCYDVAGTAVTTRPPSGVLLTPELTIPPGATGIQINPRSYGVGTVRWGRAGIFKLV